MLNNSHQVYHPLYCLHKSVFYRSSSTKASAAKDTDQWTGIKSELILSQRNLYHYPDKEMKADTCGCSRTNFNMPSAFHRRGAVMTHLLPVDAQRPLFYREAHLSYQIISITTLAGSQHGIISELVSVLIIFD